MKKIISRIAILLFLTVFLAACGAKKQGEKTEAIDIKGSDTLLQLVSSMAEIFNEKNPGADVTVTGGGSGTGIASILNGEIGLANSSRDLKEKEIKEAQAKGMDLKKIIIARDGLAVVVNTNNPVRKLTVAEVGKIFRGEIKNWKDLGGEDLAISLYGRQSTSGTYEYMKEEVLKGDYDPTMRNMEGNKAIIDAVADDKAGIGYAGIAYAVMGKDSIAALDIAPEAEKEYVSPLIEENIENGAYPITRPLYQVMNGVPPKDGIIYEFLKFETSEEGKGMIIDSGYYNPNSEDKKINQALLGE